MQDFVRKGHSDLEGVKALLEQEPRLVNACWDWGGGDWETALGGEAPVISRSRAAEASAGAEISTVRRSPALALETSSAS